MNKLSSGEGVGVQYCSSRIATMQKLFKRVYYNPLKVGSFGGVDALYKESKIHNDAVKRTQVRDWLSGEDAYTLHKGSRKRFQRRRVLVSGLNHQWQADLLDVREHAAVNDGVKFILTVIDILSKYAFAVGLKEKSGSSVTKAFDYIFSSGRVPKKLQTDRGKEFENKTLKALLKRYGVKHFVTNNEVKAAIVERFNRTLKARIWRYFTAYNTFRYIDRLQDFIESYNHSYHRTIKTAPVEVTPQNELKIWRTVYGSAFNNNPVSKSTFKKGDHVRVSRSKGVFQKGYEQTFTDEIFVIDKISTHSGVTVFNLKDYAGEEVVGCFYKEELQKIKKDQDRVYRVEKVLAKKGNGARRQCLVKWRGWPDKFNSWVSESELKDIQSLQQQV